MWMSVHATREAKGSTFKGPLNIKTVECGTSGSVTITCEGTRDPTSKATATEYVGQFDFESDEIIRLFRFLFQNSSKSNDFKRVCDAVADEMLDKPR